MLAHCSSVATVAAGFDEEVTVVALTFDPFREMDRLTSQLLGTGTTGRSPRWMPMDLYRVDDHYVVTVDLPGVDPGSIDLNVDGNTLTISAERSLRSDEGVQWLAQERPVGSYLRQLQLGDGLDVERIQASYDSGVLTVTIPVAERARPRRITVEAGGGRTAVDANRTVQGEVTSS
jgi:HSP20 family protein